MLDFKELDNIIYNPVRRLDGEVSVNGIVYDNRSELLEFTIDRLGEESKFFGFGVVQKINVKLRDKDRVINIDNSIPITAAIKVGDMSYWVFPNFKITEVNRDENTNQLSITGYDGLYKATAHTFSELALTPPYTIRDVVVACGELLGVNYSWCEGDAFTTSYPEGANLEGSETIKDVLDAIAQATQTVYYINPSGALAFRQLDKSHTPDFIIDKNKYFTLTSGDNRRLTSIVSATELGDNYSASTGLVGTTQYVRNNPFWDMRNDIATLLQAAIDRIGNISINQFDCSWRGDFRTEVGDCIGLITKDNDLVYSYLLNDTITYDGSLTQKTKWSFTDNEAETAANPITLGEALKQTYAKVDKVNKEIELVVSDTNENRELISSIQLDTNSISASVVDIERKVAEGFEDVNTDIEELTKKVNAQITAEDLEITIEQKLNDGINSVTTTTGYTFNEDGLTVSKTDSEMTTTITEDGMTVYKNDEAMLEANNTGVYATNLHARTYLIIGLNSRFEDYDNNSRTGCFWIGN